LARRLIWSPRARQNLREIIDNIARDAPANAGPVARRFFQRVASLPDQPGQGRLVPEHDAADGLREVFVHRWRVIYRVVGDGVEIVAILHGARLLKNAPPL
jgi:plasmid stabilization system protein ParE